MKKWLVVCALLVGLPALAGPEAWIPLEDLPAEDQAKALDAEEIDRDKRDQAPAWSEATDQLVEHALFTKVLLEVGADLLSGVK